MSNVYDHLFGCSRDLSLGCCEISFKLRNRFFELLDDLTKLGFFFLDDLSTRHDVFLFVVCCFVKQKGVVVLMIRDDANKINANLTLRAKESRDFFPVELL